MAAAQIVRSMIEAENKNISDRLGWLLTTQGFLIAGLGLAWDKREARPLTLVMSCLGLSVSLITLLALIGSTRAQARLLKWWNDTRSGSYSGPPVMGLEPPFQSRLALLAPWNWTAFLFLVAWAVIVRSRLG